MKNEQLILTCSCGDIVHVIRFTSWDDDGTICIEMLREPKTFWERLKLLFKKHWAVQDVVLSEDQADELREWIDR
jgi:nicotinamide riboside kinase